MESGSASPGSVGTFDYIVIGGGTAGCVLANRLSADPSVSVLVLEAGGQGDGFWIPVPLAVFKTIGNPRTDWCFKTDAEPGLNGRSITVPRGLGLGGCTLINGMVYIRGQARDYDRWRELGNSGWGWEDVLPYFKRSEDFVHGADEAHGAGGEWRVEDSRTRWKILDAFRDAAAEIGIPRSDDVNRGDNEGCGYFHVNQTRGVRLSAAGAFLRTAMKRPNLRVITNALASGLRFDGRRATGIEFRQGDTPCRAEARAETILAAGTIGSPQLLQLSGVGPGALLQAHGIEVHQDLPGVGENLQDHFQVRMMFRVRNAPTINERANSPVGRLGMGLQYFLFRRGPLSMAPAQLGAFTRSDPSLESPDIQYHVIPLSYEGFGTPHPFPAFTATSCVLRPASRGHVRIRSADPRAHPAIRQNFLAAAEDRRLIVESARLTRRICAARALAPYSPEEFKPGTQVQTDEEILGFARENGISVFHPVGTCRMGADASAVVDARLRVRGLSGLRVVDASIMPTITSGNTCSPVIMIAEKASDMILEDRRGAASQDLR